MNERLKNRFKKNKCINTNRGKSKEKKSNKINRFLRRSKPRFAFKTVHRRIPSQRPSHLRDPLTSMFISVLVPYRITNDDGIKDSAIRAWMRGGVISGSRLERAVQSLYQSISHSPRQIARV